MGPEVGALWWVIWLHTDSLEADYHGIIFFPCGFFPFLPLLLQEQVP